MDLDMKKHEITTSKGEFVVVDYNILPKIDKMLIDGDSRFIKLSEATEEDAKGVVDEHEYPWLEGEYCYPDYEVYGKTGFKAFDTAIDSLRSLLTSKGIDINSGNWYLFKNA